MSDEEIVLFLLAGFSETTRVSAHANLENSNLLESILNSKYENLTLPESLTVLAINPFCFSALFHRIDRQELFELTFSCLTALSTTTIPQKWPCIGLLIRMMYSISNKVCDLDFNDFHRVSFSDMLMRVMEINEIELSASKIIDSVNLHDSFEYLYSRDESLFEQSSGYCLCRGILIDYMCLSDKWNIDFISHLLIRSVLLSVFSFDELISSILDELFVFPSPRCHRLKYVALISCMLQSKFAGVVSKVLIALISQLILKSSEVHYQIMMELKWFILTIMNRVSFSWPWYGWFIVLNDTNDLLERAARKLFMYQLFFSACTEVSYTARICLYLEAIENEKNTTAIQSRNFASLSFLDMSTYREFTMTDVTSFSKHCYRSSCEQITLLHGFLIQSLESPSHFQSTLLEHLVNFQRDENIHVKNILNYVVEFCVYAGKCGDHIVNLIILIHEYLSFEFEIIVDWFLGDVLKEFYEQDWPWIIIQTIIRRSITNVIEYRTMNQYVLVQFVTFFNDRDQLLNEGCPGKIDSLKYFLQQKNILNNLEVFLWNWFDSFEEAPIQESLVLKLIAFNTNKLLIAVWTRVYNSLGRKWVRASN